MQTLPIRKDAAFPLTAERKQWQYVLDDKDFIGYGAVLYLQDQGYDPLEAHSFTASLRAEYERLNPRWR